MRFITVATAVLCAALLAPVANATKPDRSRIPVGDPPYVELPGDYEFCPASIAPDGVSVEVIDGNHAVSDFASGRSTVTGRHVDRFTNLANGKSITVELQGRATFVAQDDGSVRATLSGVLGYNFWPGDEGPGNTNEGRTYVFTGPVDLVFDSSGAVSAFSSKGRMVDVCALVAD